MSGIRVRSYDVFARAVEEGIDLGWRRAHKHTDAPSTEALQESLLDAITSSVCEVFEFSPGEGEDAALRDADGGKAEP